MFFLNFYKKLFTTIPYLIVLAFTCVGCKEKQQQQPTPLHYGDNSAAGNYANINGIKLYYEIYGEGAPLVLIHGNGGSISSMWEQIGFF